MLPLLATPGQLRRFLLVSAQSSVGTAMGYVALLLLAHDQLDSAWALGLVLTANLLPPAVLGPYFGHLADRRSRRSLCVAADLLRAAAFAALAVSPNLTVTVLLTLVAGTGNALYVPASRSAVPTIAREHTDEAVGALAALTSAAALIGPAAGAVVLLAGPVHVLLALNAVTFAISAVVLTGLTLDGPRAPSKPWVPMSLEEALAEERFNRRAIREGVVAARGVPGLVFVIAAAAGATFTLAFSNVGEPLLATGPLDGGDAAFSLIVAVFGLGATAGALLGAASVRRLVAGILAGAVVMGLIAVSPSLPVALVLFALGGIVEGVTISCDQRLVTLRSPERIIGRVFGLKDSLDSMALLAAYLLGSAVAAEAGARWVFGASAIGTAVVGLAALVTARRGSGGPATPVPRRASAV